MVTLGIIPTEIRSPFRDAGSYVAASPIAKTGGPNTEGNKTAHAHTRTTKTTQHGPADRRGHAARRVESTSEQFESRLTTCLFLLTVVAGYILLRHCRNFVYRDFHMTRKTYKFLDIGS